MYDSRTDRARKGSRPGHERENLFSHYNVLGATSRMARQTPAHDYDDNELLAQFPRTYGLRTVIRRETEALMREWFPLSECCEECEDHMRDTRDELNMLDAMVAMND